jgi:hypothetical protein
MQSEVNNAIATTETLEVNSSDRAQVARKKNLDLALERIAKDFGEGAIMRLGASRQHWYSIAINTRSSSISAIRIRRRRGNLSCCAQKPSSRFWKAKSSSFIRAGRMSDAGK